MGHFGACGFSVWGVLKVDDHTLDRSQAKFARVCVEINLEKPLKQGTWVNYGDFSVFVLVLYENLPVFCYKCGRVGHGETTRPLASSHLNAGSSVPSASVEAGMVQNDSMMQVDGVSKDQAVCDDHLALSQNSPGESELCPWLKPRRRHVATHGMGGSHGGASRPGTRNPSYGGSSRNPDSGGSWETTL